MFYVNSELFPRKCEQFDQNVDNIVHTWRAMVNSIRKQYTWTVFLLACKYGQFYLGMDNIVHTFYELGAQYHITQKSVFTQKLVLPRPLSANLVYSVTLT